jgi:zinc/manganese transport system substrate-binding protein
MTFGRINNAFSMTVFIAVLLLLSSTASAKLHVVTTLSDYGALIQALGGDHVEVRVLASPLQDPHYVDAKPSFIVTLNRADWLISNGLELEIGWLPKLVVQSRNPRIQPGQHGNLVVGNHVSNLLGTSQGPIDRSMGDVHPGGNPHFYNDPTRMHKLIPLFTEHLIRLDPANKADYRNNLLKVQNQFEALLQQLSQQFQSMPPERRKVVTYHKSFEYFLQSLGLEVVAYIEPKPGVAPTPSHIAKVLSLMKQQGVRVIIQETYYPSRTGSTLASLAGATVVKLQGGTSIDQSYIEHIRDNASRLQKALQGESTP